MILITSLSFWCTFYFFTALSNLVKFLLRACAFALKCCYLERSKLCICALLIINGMSLVHAQMSVIEWIGRIQKSYLLLSIKNEEILLVLLREFECSKLVLLLSTVLRETLQPERWSCLTIALEVCEIDSGRCQKKWGNVINWSGHQRTVSQRRPCAEAVNNFSGINKG